MLKRVFFASIAVLLLVACRATKTSLPEATEEPRTAEVSPTATQAELPSETETLASEAVPESAPTATEVRTPVATAEAPAEAEEPTPTEAPVAGLEPRVEVVAAGLEVPWGLAFAPDGRLFVTERSGRIRVIADGVLQPEPVARIAVASVGEGGLMGLALDPDFEATGYLYIMYTYEERGALWNRISRLTLEGSTAGDEVVLLERIPGARYHDGGQLRFGPDGKLYATTGDASQMDLAQDRNSLAGKILRLNRDGSIPNDNPYEGSPVYSYGHRNPQGLAWQPGTQQLWSVEHGPTGEMGLCCRDEVNRIVPGGNYGWPVVTLPAGDERFVDPALNSGNDTWAPSGAAFYDAEPLAPWRGNLFFGTLRGQHLQRLELGGPDGALVLASERLFQGEYGRIRAVALGPDGYLYFSTSNRDGRGQPATEDDRVLRIVPGP